MWPWMLMAPFKFPPSIHFYITSYPEFFVQTESLLLVKTIRQFKSWCLNLLVDSCYILFFCNKSMSKKVVINLTEFLADWPIFVWNKSKLLLICVFCCLVLVWPMPVLTGKTSWHFCCQCLLIQSLPWRYFISFQELFRIKISIRFKILQAFVYINLKHVVKQCV